MIQIISSISSWNPIFTMPSNGLKDKKLKNIQPSSSFKIPIYFVLFSLWRISLMIPARTSTVLYSSLRYFRIRLSNNNERILVNSELSILTTNKTALKSERFCFNLFILTLEKCVFCETV